MTDSERDRAEIVVGLVATPPDYPARLTARLTAELAVRVPKPGTRVLGHQARHHQGRTSW